MRALLGFLKRMSSVAGKGSETFRIFKSVQGLNDKANDVIYHSPSVAAATGTVIFFGGDVQDYAENMLFHRDNKVHVHWSLENTSILLHNKFPSSNILVIRPVRMHLKTFCCYENFVDGNNFGAPEYSATPDSVKHLQLLSQNIVSIINSEKDVCSSPMCTLPITIVGFSKGCVVLNQILHSFFALSKSPEKEVTSFVDHIVAMFWLDGAHCGTSDTWVMDKGVLSHLAQLPVKIRIHVSPYQVQCDMRPRIGKEEKVFRETLKRLGSDVRRTLHFEDQPRSIEFHFKVLEVFPPSDD